MPNCSQSRDGLPLVPLLQNIHVRNRVEDKAAHFSPYLFRILLSVIFQDVQNVLKARSLHKDCNIVEYYALVALIFGTHTHTHPHISQTFA